MDKKIAIIGGGNLGTAIAEGLVASTLVNPTNITVTRRRIEQIDYLKEKGIHTSSKNAEAVKGSAIVILAVKPYQLKMILKEIEPELVTDKHILISVVTGVGVEEIATDTGKRLPVFRAMPNTAIAIRESMTCISSFSATKEQEELVVRLFDSLGRAIIIDESLMAAATVLGASGIAFSLRFIRAESQGGTEIGFDAQTAQLIAAQTVRGAASLLLERGQHPEREIDRVTTPMGCTIAGLNEMEHQGFSSALIKGITTSYQKIDKIAEDYDR